MNARTVSRALRGALILLSALGEASAQRQPAAPQPPLSQSHVIQRQPAITRSPDPGRACVGVRGCAAPREIPACGAVPADAITLEQLWQRRASLAGRPVALATRLEVNAPCTELACADQCCNTCGGAVTLPSIGNLGQLVHLSTDEDPAMRCAGDDSGLCCATRPPEGRTLVTGTLSRMPRGWHDHWRIDGATLCRIP